MSLVTTISSSALKVGKHKIPKYLYHITPTKNVENIQKKGLQMTEDDLFGEGVFMFDLANLTKFWTKTNNKQKTNFAQTLIDYVTRRSGNFSISIFRIPTKNIPTDALSIRRQDKLFEIGNKYETTSDIYNAYAREEITDLQKKIYRYSYSFVDLDNYRIFKIPGKKKRVFIECDYSILTTLEDGD